MVADIKKGVKKDSQKTAVHIIYWSAVTGMILLVIGLTAIGAGRAYHLGYAIFHDTPYDSKNTTEIVVTVPEGCTMQTMARALEEESLIADDMVFYLQSQLYRYELSPGKHVISASMTSAEILKALSETDEANGETSDK